MSDAGDVYDGGVIVDGVDNAIIPYADPPLLRATDQFLASGWTRVGGEPLNPGYDTDNDCGGQPLQLPFGAR